MTKYRVSVHKALNFSNFCLVGSGKVEGWKK